MTDDDRLMIDIQSGDPVAFERLVEKYQSPLIGFFFRNTHDRQLSEDLTQETLLRVHQQAWDYLAIGRFRSWMFRIARNLMIDDFRRRSSDALVRSVTGQADQEQDAMQRVADEILPAQENVLHQELAELVDEGLAALPEEQRLAFTLHHYVGLKLPEVAEIMETPLATCKSRLRLAREKLQAFLQSKGIRASAAVAND